MSDCCSEKESTCCSTGKQPPAACCDATDSCCGPSPRKRFDFLLWGSLALFAAGAAVHLTGMAVPGWLHVFGHTCYELMLRSWWGILTGIAAAAVIGRVPRELIAAMLGRGGTFGGLLRAVGAGVALDLCNHGILLVGMSLYKRGASLGQVFAFLIASPWNSLSLTLILASLIGWKWMLLFIALSAVVAVTTGWIADRFVALGNLAANPHAIALPADFNTRQALRGLVRALKPGWTNWLALGREGLADSRMILRWLLFGFVLTGALRAFVPLEVFQQYFGPSLVGLLLTLLATTVIEVCSEGSSPVAADLLTRARAPGNAFVFLMAGAATDYTEIASLKETTRSWKMAFALPLLATPQVVLVGLLIHHFSKG